MTRREKVLAMCVGGALGGLALYGLVNWMVVRPFKAAHKEIDDERKRQQRLTLALKQLDHVEKDWQELTKRTFSVDAKEAERGFREDMHQLLERHGLRDPKVSPGSPIKYKDGSVGVPLTINATGTLNKIVGFLCDFYRREYLARLDKVRITADQSVVSNVNTTRGRAAGVRQGRATGGPPGRTSNELGPDGPELKVNISAVTLVLPPVDKIPHLVMPEIVELENGRNLRPLSEYSYIYDKNLFLPYQEKPKVVVDATPVATKPVDPGPPPPPPPPPPPVRPGADQLFVRGLMKLNGEETVYVYDERKKAEPPTLYKVDQPIDDGTLIEILPEGLVVRVEKPGGGHTDYFYPLGKSFKDRQEVNPDDHPFINAVLKRDALL
jgi:hypothetical protein